MDPDSAIGRDDGTPGTEVVEITLSDSQRLTSTL